MCPTLSSLLMPFLLPASPLLFTLDHLLGCFQVWIYVSSTTSYIYIYQFRVLININLPPPMSKDPNILSPQPLKAPTAANNIADGSEPSTSESSFLINSPPPPASATPLQNIYSPLPGLQRTKTNNYKSELEAQLIQNELSNKKGVTVASDVPPGINEYSPGTDNHGDYKPTTTELERRTSEKATYEHMQSQLFKRRASHVGVDGQDPKGGDVDTASVISDTNSNLYTSGQKPHLIDHIFPHQVIHDIKEKLKVVEENKKIQFHSPFHHSEHHIHGQGHTTHGLEHGELSSAEITPKDLSSSEIDTTAPPPNLNRKSFSFNDYKKDMYRKSLSDAHSEGTS